MPTMEEYAAAGGYQRDAQIANDVASRGIDSYSSPSSPSSYTERDNSQSDRASWMGNQYSKVAGTDWYSTNPTNPNAAKYRADGSPVASVGYSNQQTGQNFSGYATPEQFQQIKDAPNDAARNTLYEQFLKAKSLVSNDSIYGPPTPSGTPSSVNSGTQTGGVSNPTTVLSTAKSSPTMQTATLTPNTYTKNPTVDAKPLEEQLAYYKANPQEGMQEIQRAKDVYAAAKTQQEKDDANMWARHLREALGIKDTDPQYGEYAAPTTTKPVPIAGTDVPVTGKVTGKVTGEGSTDGYPGTNLGDATKVAKGNDQFTQSLMQQLLQSQQNMFDRNSAAAQQQQALAQQQAQLIVNQKLAQYQNLVGSLQTGQQNDLQAISGSVENAKSSIEDKSFQDWLGARQDAANRGLGSSGIAGDANTRLLLAKQKDLANMYTQKQSAANDVNRSYGDKLAAARTEIAQTNVPQTSAELFNKMFSDTSSKYGEQSKMFADLLGKQLGYSQVNPKDALDYQAINNQTAGRYQAAVAKLNSNAQLKIAEMQQKYQTDMTKIMGVDSEGNLTVDAKNLMETMRHNQSTEGITASHNAATTAIAQMNANVSAGNLQVNRDRLTDTINHNVAQLDLATKKFTDSHTAGQAKVLYDAAQLSQGEANSAIKMKADYMMNNYQQATTQEYKDKLAGYDEAIKAATKKIDDASSAMQEITQLRDSEIIK